MKRVTSPATVLFLTICALLLASANQSLLARTQTDAKDYPGADDRGRFIIGYSPTLGMNVGLVVRIDGREAGAITKGHIYHRHLSPGRYLINVSPNGRQYDALHTTLDVRPGQTYSYVAKYNRYHMVLQPALVSR